MLSGDGVWRELKPTCAVANGLQNEYRCRSGGDNAKGGLSPRVPRIYTFDGWKDSDAMEGGW